MKRLIAIALLSLSCAAATCQTPITPPTPQPLVDGGAWVCRLPSDGPACACDTLSHFGCREGNPTALGTTCIADSRYRLTVPLTMPSELQENACLGRAASVSDIRSCGVRCE